MCAFHRRPVGNLRSPSSGHTSIFACETLPVARAYTRPSPCLVPCLVWTLTCDVLDPPMHSRASFQHGPTHPARSKVVLSHPQSFCAYAVALPTTSQPVGVAGCPWGQDYFIYPHFFSWWGIPESLLRGLYHLW